MQVVKAWEKWREAIDIKWEYEFGSKIAEKWLLLLWSIENCMTVNRMLEAEHL